jgi:Membrane carboxypeptidase/penicillin-binding protein
MCFTPSLVTGCWVGGDNRGIHFDRLTEGQGAAMALPIAGIFMKKVYSNKELGYFETEAFEVSEAYLNPCKTREDEEEETSSSAPTRMIDEFFD